MVESGEFFLLISSLPLYAKVTYVDSIKKKERKKSPPGMYKLYINIEEDR